MRLGEKFRDSEGRLTINSAGYFENWQHIQQNIPLECGFPFTGNAGDAHIYGAELEITALLLPGLMASASGSWNACGIHRERGAGDDHRRSGAEHAGNSRSRARSPTDTPSTTRSPS